MEKATGIPTGSDEERFDGLISLEGWNDRYPGRLVFRSIGHGWDDEVPKAIELAKNSVQFDDVKILVTSGRFEVCGLLKEEKRTDVLRFVVASNIKHTMNKTSPNPSMEIVTLGG